MGRGQRGHGLFIERYHDSKRKAVELCFTSTRFCLVYVLQPKHLVRPQKRMRLSHGQVARCMLLRCMWTAVAWPIMEYLAIQRQTGIRKARVRV